MARYEVVLLGSTEKAVVSLPRRPALTCHGSPSTMRSYLQCKPCCLVLTKHTLEEEQKGQHNNMTCNQSFDAEREATSQLLSDNIYNRKYNAAAVFATSEPEAHGSNFN